MLKISMLIVYVNCIMEIIYLIFVTRKLSFVNIRFIIDHFNHRLFTQGKHECDMEFLKSYK
jgi:hypothetical protein